MTLVGDLQGGGGGSSSTTGSGGGGKEAAAREREERLHSARNQLKSYRSRNNASPSLPSSSSASIPKRASLVLTAPSNASGSSHQGHRKSLSKGGNVIPSHGRKASKSRPSSSSIPGAAAGVHTPTRSRTSFSYATASSPATSSPLLTPRYLNDRVHEPDLPIPFMDFSSGSGRRQDFDSLAGWQIGVPLSIPLQASSSSTISASDGRKSRRTSLIYGSASTFFNNEVQQMLASASIPLIPEPITISAIPISVDSATPTSSPSSAAAVGPSVSSHTRRPSRHNRQSSVSNFRESIEIMSGTGVFLGGLSPGVSSFAGAAGSTPPLSLSPRISPRLGTSSSPSGSWTNDPVKVLEILKERGRLESAMESDPIRTRQGALEALEGRLSAPSAMIDLGNLEGGQLLVAPPSPGYTYTAPSTSSTSTLPISPFQSVGLGLLPSNPKRNSWGTSLGPVTAVGAKGALDLGMLVEEEEGDDGLEEDDDDDEDILPTSPTKVKRSPSSKGRPQSLTFLPSAEEARSVLSNDTPIQPSFAARPLRLSTSSVSSPSDLAVAPTPIDSPSRTSALRSLTLSASPSSKLQHAINDNSFTSPSDKRRSSSHLLFQSIPAAAHAPPLAPRPASMRPTGSSSSASVAPAPPLANRGLRALSTGMIHNSLDGVTTAPSSAPPVASLFNRSPILSRRQSGGTFSPPTSVIPSQISTISPRHSATSSSPNPNAKRSSISYLTNTTPSLASTDGPLSPSSQAARRPWRASLSGSTATPSPPSASYTSPPIIASTPSATVGGYAFPFASSHGNLGGFGDLEVEEEAPITTPSRRPRSSSSGFALTSPSSTEEATMSISVRSQLESLRLSLAQQAAAHARQLADLQKQASEDARLLRLSIVELERQLEEVRVGRRFEVEGLSREVEQATEAMTDLREERDSLVEDVEGWRSRCATLESTAKVERDHETMAKAQAKLGGEMRDQIYSLVEALERERELHSSTRNELERSMIGPASPLLVGEQDGDDTEGEEVEFAHRINGISLDHPFNNASRPSSILSTSSSFGQSRSGSTTEETSITADFDDVVPIRYRSNSSPPFSQSQSIPSHHTSSSLGSKGRDVDFAGAATLGGLHTLAEEEEEDEDLTSRIIERDVEAMIDGVNAQGFAHEEVEGMALLEEDLMTEEQIESDRIRLGSGSTDSTDTSEAMPSTPMKESLQLHNRSDSFVRHWSFPKGSIAPIRISGDDHSFFDLGRHSSLPALPIAASTLPPFLCADLTVDDDHYSSFTPSFATDSRFSPSSEPSHSCRPSSPRPMDRMRPHSKRFSGQFKPPPISPSGFAHAAMQSSTASLSSSIGSSSLNSITSPTASAFASLSRLSFGNLSNLLSYVSPGSSYSPQSAPASASASVATKQSLSYRRSDGRWDDSFAASTPTRGNARTTAIVRHIRPEQVRAPRRSPLSKLDFRTVCCEDGATYVV